MKYPLSKYLLACCALGLPLAPATYAQQESASTQGAPAATDQASRRARAATSEDDEPVQMDVFQVQGRSANNAYLQTETTTGTRIATNIGELPFQVASITSEFLEDFDMFDPGGGDLNNMVSGLSDVTSEGNFSLRGFTSTYSMRDGFYRLGLIDRSNTDRVDVIKGPSAAMYGQTTPSGMVNYISKRPKSKRSGQLLVGAGSNNFARGEVSLNTPLNSSGTLLNLLTAAATQTNTPSNPYEKNFYGNTKNKNLFDSFVWRITPMTQFSAQVEWAKRTGINSMTNTIFSGTANPQIGTLDQVNKRLSNLSQRGPGAFQNREQTAVNATLEHRFNQIFSARIGGNFYYRRAIQLGTNTTGYNNGTSATYGPYIMRNGTTTFNPSSSVFDTRTMGSEYYSHLIENGGAIQSDITARYRMFGGRANASSLLMVDFNTNRRRRKQEQMSQARQKELFNANVGFTGNTVFVDNPDYLYYQPVRSDYTSINRNDDTSFYNIGIFLRQQVQFFDNRLRTYAGMRFDYLRFDQTFGDQFNQDGSYAQFSSTSSRRGDKTTYTEIKYDNAWSPCIGVNYQYTRNVALYLNYSKSFSPNAQNTQMGSNNLPNELGSGWDYGIKANMFESQLWLTLGGFYVVRDGVKVIGSVEQANVDDPVYEAGGQHVAKGVELDMTWDVGAGVWVGGGYGYVHTEVVKNPGVAKDLVGRPTQAIPQDTGYLAVRYKFPEPLNGLSANFRLVYTGRSNPYSNNSSNNATGIALRDWEVPSYAVINAGLAYQFKIRGMRGYKHTIRGTVKNIADREYVDKKGNYIGTGRSLVFTYTLGF